MMGGGNLVRCERYRKGPRTPRSAHARYYYTRSLVLESPVKKRRSVPRIRCQSAPKVMDSHSRSASPREPMRPQHRPPSPPSPAAFDNRAYQHDESDANHNDSFTSNGTQQNGHTKEPNGVSDTKTLEAVNLELINLTPKNGNAKQKKDVEVDMNTGNPYDEYFVPVNEHRKYMRGEKLYVTADKRGDKGGCKRPLCWTLLGLVVAAIVALIVLAATGVLFTNSPTPLEPYNSSVSSARALGGIGNGHAHVHSQHDHSQHEQSEHDHSQHEQSEHDHSQHEQSDELSTEPSKQHGPETQSDEQGHEHSLVSEEAGDFVMYVPRTVEGELKVDNEDFTPALDDPESSEYKEFVSSFTDGLKRALFNRAELENGDNEIMVEVVQLRKGSVIVTYRIHWKPKPQAEPTEELLSANTLKTNLNDYLKKSNRMISIYHIADDKMATRQVLDICQINKNGCEYGCEFDETTLDFTCTCPHGQILDLTDMKRCMPILETTPEQNTQDKQKDFRVLTIDAKPITTRTMPDDEKPATKSMHVLKNTFDWKETHHMMPDTTTDSDTDVNFSHIFGHPTDKQHEEFDSEENPEPVPNAEPSPEPEPTSEPEPDVKPEPEPNSDPKPETKSEPESEIKMEVEPKSEPEPEPKSEPAPEPTVEPEPERKSKSETKENSEPKAEPMPTTPSSEVAMHGIDDKKLPGEPITAEQHDFSKSEQTIAPQAEPEPPQTTTAKVQVIPEIPSIIEPEIMHTTEHELESDIEAEPVTEYSKPTTLSESNHESELHTDHLTTSEEKSILYTNEGKFEYKSDTAFPAETTTMRISISEPNIINEPSYEPKPEIISILSDKRESINEPTVSEITTETNEWLEDYPPNNTEIPSMQIDDKPEAYNNTYEDIINNSIKNHNMHESEQRSFKTSDEDYVFETTTIQNSNEVIPFNQRIKDNEHVTVDSLKMYEETSMPSITIIPVATTEISAGKESEESVETTTGMTNEVSPAEFGTTSSIEDAESLDTNKTENEVSTQIPEPLTETYSIKGHVADSAEDKLMEVLEKKDLSSESNKTSTESHIPEGTDVTFDAINMLFNRISKSFEKDNNSENAITEKNESMKETTTDSEWLSEPFTQVTYNEAMNKMEKHDTTDSINKMGDIISHGLSKEDFEPDYLNNMGSNNNKPEQEVPLYSMVHDYDNEDNRYKRVNKEGSIEKTMKNVTNEVAGSIKTNTSAESNEITTEISSATSAPIELTTVSDYIFKVADKSNVKPEVILEMQNKTETTNEPSPTTVPSTIMNAELETNSSLFPALSEITKTKITTSTPYAINETETIQTSSLSTPVATAVPAPVWEESEAEKDLTVKALLKIEMENIKNNETVSIEEIQTLNTTITTTTTTESVPEINAKVSTTNAEIYVTTESSALNSTQLNNLNVTIYEISSHSGNNSFPVAKPANAQSAEFEDHETDMNPFLPEVENNKILVKKLIEGHDIEPANLNETQNENVEDHAVHSSEGHALFNSATTTSSSEVGETKEKNEPAPMTTDEDASFNELLHSVGVNPNTNENLTTTATQEKTDEHSSETTKMNEKEILPVSTFLMDTDDLIGSKDHSTTISVNNVESDTSKPTTSAPEPNNDNEYLSVVPITEEKELKKEHKSENLEELNNISDLPKKSDERTLDATKFDSVNNNEA